MLLSHLKLQKQCPRAGEKEALYRRENATIQSGLRKCHQGIRYFKILLMN